MPRRRAIGSIGFNAWRAPSRLETEICVKQQMIVIAQMIKNLPEVCETWVRCLGWGDSPEKEMTTHSSIPAWRISRTEEPGRYSVWGGKELDMTEQLVQNDRKPEIAQRGLCRRERGGPGPQSRNCPRVGLSRLVSRAEAKEPA